VLRDTSGEGLLAIPVGRIHRVSASRLGPAGCRRLAFYTC